MSGIADSLVRIADALEELVRAAKEGKETFPPTTPYKEKGEGQTTTDARVRVREGFIAPDCGMVISVAATLGIGKECAEEFWNYYEARGWILGKTKMRFWKRVLDNWVSTENDRARRRRGAKAPTAQRNIVTFNAYKPVDTTGAISILEYERLKKEGKL